MVVDRGVVCHQKVVDSVIDAESVVISTGGREGGEGGGASVDVVIETSSKGVGAAVGNSVVVEMNGELVVVDVVDVVEKVVVLSRSAWAF